jgi:hypothetical protein
MAVQEAAVLGLSLLPVVLEQPDKEILEVLAYTPHQIMAVAGVVEQVLWVVLVLQLLAVQAELEQYL